MYKLLQITRVTNGWCMQNDLFVLSIRILFFFLDEYKIGGHLFVPEQALG